MSRYRSGPSPFLIVLIGALMVFGGYYVWVGFLSYLEDRGDITAQITREAVATATAQSEPFQRLPTIFVPATFTPLPPCQMFRVSVERAVYRECPSTDNRECPVREVVPFGTELCVYSRAPENAEWYVVELNPGGAFRDTVFMHESVIEAVNPTPTPTATFTPLPTISPTPSPDAPSIDLTPTFAETPTVEGTPSHPPNLTPTPTIRQIIL